MRWNKGRVLFIILLFAAIWFTALKVQEAAYIKSRYTSVSIRYKEDGVKLQSLRAALEKETARGGRIPEITAWRWINETEVRNALLNRSRQAAEIIAVGNMEVTAPMTLAQGNYVTGEDFHGCILDSETAYALFGTEKAVGNTISVDQTDYIIRGIVKTVFPVVLIQGNRESLAYPNLEFVYDGRNKEMGEQSAADFIFQNGLPTDYVIIDGYCYGKMLGSALCLPVWLFYLLTGLSVIIYYVRHKKRFTTLSFVLYGLAGLVMVIGYGIFLYNITGTPVYLPEKILPAKWSDFGNWEDFFGTVQNQVRQLGYLAPNSKDVFLKDEISKLLLNTAVLGAFYVLIYWWVYKKLSAADPVILQAYPDSPEQEQLLLKDIPDMAKDRKAV
jgi:hypothetical protein